MPALTISDFASFADALVAACYPSGRGGEIAAIAAEMARRGEDHALYFTHPGRARDDAIALFWQAAPSAFADPAAFAAGYSDPALTTDRMVAAIRAGPLARDFFASSLPEALFRAVAFSALGVLHDRVEAKS